MQTTEYVLEIEGLSLRRETVQILEGINWKVRPQEHWVLLGANGSGKSTLLAALTGYTSPTSGSISVLGHVYRRYDWRELRTRIGLVSAAIQQRIPEGEPVIETVLSGKYAMLGYWGEITEEDLREARAITEQVECDHVAHRQWRYLSQGERQRVLVGRALMARPDLLILDEPCAGLDPAAREHFLHFLERVAERPDAPAIVFVTHHVEEIMPFFTHALLLKDGRVLDAGPIESVLDEEKLSRAFGCRADLVRTNGRYQLAIRSASGRIFR